jgi:uncharacterized protein YwqG
VTESAEVQRYRELLRAICGRHLAANAAATVESLARPAIRLVHGAGPTRSHLGGAAFLDDEAHWPRWHDRPLSLVAVIDLADLAGLHSDPQLPPEGTVNFFYDHEQQPWGFDPGDRGGWRVVRASSDGASPVAAPAEAETFVSVGLLPQQILTLPGWEEPAAAPLFPRHADRSARAAAARDAFSAVEDEWRRLLDLESAPNHQIGGWPLLQQGPIWRECDVVSRGLAMGSSEEWRQAEPMFDVEREADWRLLLQLDTDDDAGWVWGDVGTLYFTIPRSHPIGSAYEEAWLVLQCC